MIWECGPGNCRHKGLVLQLRSCYPEPTGNYPSVCPHTAPASSSDPSPLPLPPPSAPSLWMSPNPHRGKKNTQKYPNPKVPAATQILGEEALQAGIALTTNPQSGAEGCACNSRCKHPPLTVTGMSQALFYPKKRPDPGVFNAQNLLQNREVAPKPPAAPEEPEAPRTQSSISFFVLQSLGVTPRANKSLIKVTQEPVWIGAGSGCC